MRFYTYKCENNHRFERHEKTDAPRETKCDVCGAKAERVITKTYFGGLNEMKQNWGRRA
jgi:putative FmdB family regulatory protein